jgi:hypothetical protein
MVRGETPVAATSASSRLMSRVVIVFRGPIAERRHDETGMRSGAALVRRARLGEQVAVVAQRRRLGAAHALEPIEVHECGTAT